jgi:uncharacterized protein (TIGR03437 family)
MHVLDRRRALMLFGSAGAAALLAPKTNLAEAATSFACVDSPPATEGPYWVDEKLNRSDIRPDPSNGSISPGVLLALTINVHQVTSAGCSPLAGAQVDIWHCDAAGIYSDEAANNSVGRKFLRGYQISDDSGAVQFITIYPGWYSGRTVHIHVRVRTFSGSTVLDEFTSQLFFDDSITDQVFTQSPYNTRRARDTRNANDMVLSGMTNGSTMFVNLTQTSLGYAAFVDIGVTLKTVAANKAAISANGVVNAAGFQPGAAPGAWISVFGQNLAATTRTLTAADVVDGKLPTSLGGVSVQIDNQAAFLSYVSPGQINLQAPADANVGSVRATVTNAAGTSDPVNVNMHAILPAFFSSQNYVAAVRSDGTVITAAVPAKPGDVLELYGTGFGPTDPSLAPGAVFQGSAPLTNSVTVTIGGAAASVSYAGLVGAGLYQINVMVPSLPAGEHEVIARIAGLDTPSGILLKISG